MSTNPNQGQDSNQSYGGYSGYSGSQPGNAQDDQQPGYQPYQGYYQQQEADQGQQQQQQSQPQSQQQTFYQPPQSAVRAHSTVDASDATSLGWDAKLEALLSYLLWFVGGAFFLLFERKNRFVRFHAAQSVVFMGGTFAVWLVFQIIFKIWVIGPLLAAILGFPLSIVMGIAGLVWIFLMIMAYRGTTFRVPIVSDYADALLNRISKRNP
jgi:uncharacterized membrane protein